MNTPAHLILGTTLFGRPGMKGVPLAAVLGSLAPDISLYLLSFTSIWVLGISPSRVFDELYFSAAWQQVFAIDNSFVLWGMLLAYAIWQQKLLLRVFASAGLLHLLCDFFLHNEDARRQFWPLSDWVFRSPFSYWDRHHHGAVIGPMEMAMCAALSILLWRRFPRPFHRMLIVLLLGMEILPGLLFRYLL
ncbi:MAG: cobalamin biosynthesis protein CobQ [Paracoccaceae bacterium]